jgi:hypothetical protein
MLEAEPAGVPAPGTGFFPPLLYEVAIPDPDVVDNARSRLSARYPAAGGPFPGEVPARLADDLHAVSAVIDAARSAAECPAQALDVGASLVVLGNLRLHLDGLEADLLDTAQQVDLSWDLIAAIIGMPVRDAQRRHAALRARAPR